MWCQEFLLLICLCFPLVKVRVKILSQVLWNNVKTLALLFEVLYLWHFVNVVQCFLLLRDFSIIKNLNWLGQFLFFFVLSECIKASHCKTGSSQPFFSEDTPCLSFHLLLNAAVCLQGFPDSSKVCQSSSLQVWGDSSPSTKQLSEVCLFRESQSHAVKLKLMIKIKTSLEPFCESFPYVMSVLNMDEFLQYPILIFFSVFDSVSPSD